MYLLGTSVSGKTTQIKTDEEGNLLTTIIGSLPKVFQSRNLSVAAGQTLSIATLKASEGVKNVTAAFASADSFSNQIIYNDIGDDGISVGTVTAPGSTVKSGFHSSGVMYASALHVRFKNEDVVAHVINIDVMGWAN